jgi:hypothetical protein
MHILEYIDLMISKQNENLEKMVSINIARFAFVYFLRLIIFAGNRSRKPASAMGYWWNDSNRNTES